MFFIDYVHQAFQLMDQDKDGIIGKNDLRATFDNVGRLVTDKELDDMLNEAPAPINFTQLLNLFASRMSGSGNIYSYIFTKRYEHLYEFSNLAE